MGCAPSRTSEERTSLRRSLTLRQSLKLGQSRKSAIDIDNEDSTNKTSNNNNNNNNNNDNSPGTNRNTRTSNFKANDRASLAAALEDYEYEGSSHTTSTRSNDSSVVCIVRSDKLAFSGAGIRRHSRRKRRRHNGSDTTRIIVLRKPSRRDTTMAMVDERIPLKELKSQLPGGNHKKSSKNKKTSTGNNNINKRTTASSNNKPPRHDAPIKKSIKEASKKIASPLRAVRSSSILGSSSRSRESSGELSEILMVDDKSRDQILQMSVSSREFWP